MALRNLPEVLQTSLLVFVLALGVRLFWIAEGGHRLASDELDYGRLAVSLVEQGTYAVDSVPTAYRPPGYPFVLSLIYFAVGVSPTAALVVQSLLDALLAVLLYISLADKDRTAARVAGVSWALFPAAILHAGLLLTETLFTAIVFGAILLLSRKNSIPTSTAGGMLLGLACLMKPWLVIFVALFGFVALVRWGSEKRLAMAALVAALSIVPWMVRNNDLFGVFAISTNTGMNLYIGNNPDATGGYKGQFPQEIVSAVGDERRLDSVSTQLALDYISDEPALFVANAARKAARLLGSEAELLVFSLSRDQHPQRLAEQYRQLPLTATILVNLPTFCFLLIGIGGLIAAERTLYWRFVAFMFSALLLTTIIFFGSSRFRYPMMPFLVMYGSLLVAHPRAYVKTLTTGRKAVFVVAALLIIAVWITEAVLIADA